MPAHINGFVYVMAMALVMFGLLKKPLTASLMSEEDFVRRRNAWLGLTAAAFLAHSFWIYCFAAAVIVLLTAQRDRNPIALYCMLIAIVPNFEKEVWGFGVVNFLFNMSHPRLMSMLILLPIAFRLAQTPLSKTGAQRFNQATVLAFLGWCFFIAASSNNPNVTLANIVRSGFDLFVLAWLPFYVFAFGLRDLKQLREALAMLMVAFALLGFFALFETLRHWLVFEALRDPLGVPPPSLSMYVIRETAGGGALRASTVAGHPIILGFMMGVGMCVWTATRQSLKPTMLGLLPLATLSVGLLAALSRGPWVGAAAGLLAAVLVGPNAGKRFVVTGAVLFAAILGLLMTPYGDKVISYLPFIGSVERGTVDYRVKLFEISMIVFWDNPIFGNYDSIRDPRMEEMRQGQGIIDMVNTYLSLGLQFGMIGVALFVLPFVVGALVAVRDARSVEPRHSSMGITGRALAGAIVVMLTTIGTASSIEYVPVTYWPILGATTAFLGIVYRWKIAQRSAAARQPGVRRSPAGTGPLPAGSRPQGMPGVGMRPAARASTGAATAANPGARAPGTAAATAGAAAGAPTPVPRLGGRLHRSGRARKPAP